MGLAAELRGANRASNLSVRIAISATAINRNTQLSMVVTMILYATLGTAARTALAASRLARALTRKLNPHFILNFFNSPNYYHYPDQSSHPATSLSSAYCTRLLMLSLASHSVPAASHGSGPGASRFPRFPSQWRPASSKIPLWTSRMTAGTIYQEHALGVYCANHADRLHTSPLCVEEFDISDRNFRPCPCGYQVTAHHAALPIT